ncbi:hypothetical protein RHGRI_000596 [Rhododendron griersonianum]|uniref:Uncharacterized protein n=1 Tax=Rhododendron griersonianum TaxID=479676 RepID=A0AAV6LIC1_9ERIC|nr:hypothetical protein RHGRI_000596 [Rhododendron griersonianum]
MKSLSSCKQTTQNLFYPSVQPSTATPPINALKLPPTSLTRDLAHPTTFNSLSKKQKRSRTTLATSAIFSP